MAPKAVRIPNRRDAVDKVALSLLGHIEGSTYEEIIGCSPTDLRRLTSSEMGRLQDAVQTVSDRLRRMVSNGG